MSPEQVNHEVAAAVMVQQANSEVTVCMYMCSYLCSFKPCFVVARCPWWKSPSQWCIVHLHLCNMHVTFDAYSDPHMHVAS